jgi:hypothetical protein
MGVFVVGGACRVREGQVGFCRNLTRDKLDRADRTDQKRVLRLLTSTQALFSTLD